MTYESTAAWQELLDTLRTLDSSFLEGERAVTDDRHVADGYRMLATTLGVAFNAYLFPEPGRPQFVAVNTPFRRDRRWGGDNTDAYYFMCPVDPDRRYRISGNKGDSVYFSVTAYNEPAPGAWSDRIVAIVRDSDLDVDADGNFSFELGPTPDAAVLMTRDYQANPLTGRPITWHIEALDEPDPIRHADPQTAAGLRSVATWLRTMFAIMPLPVGTRDQDLPDEHALGTTPPTPRTSSPTPTRCPTPTSAGRHATRATATAVLCSTTRRWSSRTDCRRAGSGTWWCGTSSWPPVAPPMPGARSTATAPSPTAMAR